MARRPLPRMRDRMWHPRTCGCAATARHRGLSPRRGRSRVARDPDAIQSEHPARIDQQANAAARSAGRERGLHDGRVRVCSEPPRRGARKQDLGFGIGVVEPVAFLDHREQRSDVGVTCEVPAGHGIAARRTEVGRGTRPEVAGAVGRADEIRGRERRIDRRVARHDPGRGRRRQLAIDLRTRRRQHAVARTARGPEVIAGPSACEVDDPHLRGVAARAGPGSRTACRRCNARSPTADRRIAGSTVSHCLGSTRTHAETSQPPRAARHACRRSTSRRARHTRRRSRIARLARRRRCRAARRHTGKRARESQESSELVHVPTPCAVSAL